MAGFRLTDGSDGCPPTETPPASYEIPFRFDSSGKLWITSCFKGMRYFGAARHDISTGVAMGSATCLNNQPWPGAASAQGISAGTYRKVTVTNDTECDIALLTGLDMTADVTALCNSLVYMRVAALWNGTAMTETTWSMPQLIGASGYVRMHGNVSANPHDAIVEGGGSPSMLLTPGQTGEISAKLYLNHTGTPNGSETINSAASAIRIYGLIV